MDIKGLRKKSDAELQKILKQQREQVRDLRFKVSAKQHKDVRELRDVRKSVAQTLTILKEKQIVKEFNKSTKEKRI
ncbi:50S ribosomal protein L29 [Patescibacteria group bacterium]|nr:50S ribosomal protein L29 [Patescibacteria group bacterium]